MQAEVASPHTGGLPLSGCRVIERSRSVAAAYAGRLLAAMGAEVVMLEPGETLFIPRGYWHNIEYTDGGYSIALRSFDSVLKRMQGIASITKNYAVDRLMNRIMGQGWYEMKVRIAAKRAEEVLEEAQ